MGAGISALTVAMPTCATLYPDIENAVMQRALDVFFELREVSGLKKKPSTSELIDWLKLLLSGRIPPEALHNADPAKAIPPLYGALIKNEQDVQLEPVASLAEGR